MWKVLVFCVGLSFVLGSLAPEPESLEILSIRRANLPRPAPAPKSYVVARSFQKVLLIECKEKRRERDFSNIVVPISDHYGVDWQLVTAVMAAESGFNPCATSPNGAMGLMQVTPQTARKYKVHQRELYEPEKNIRAGVQHLAMLSNRYNGDLTLTVAAYNAGEGAVDKFGGVPPYEETRLFVRKVLEYRLNLQANSSIRKLFFHPFH